MRTLLKITYLLPLLGIELLFLRRSARSVVALSTTVSARQQTLVNISYLINYVNFYSRHKIIIDVLLSAC